MYFAPVYPRVRKLKAHVSKSSLKNNPGITFYVSYRSRCTVLAQKVNPVFYLDSCIEAELDLYKRELKCTAVQ